MSTENPLVSIIIPTYNRAHLIGETLDSVLAQTYPNWECIVVDDGSTDNTEALMADYMARDARFQYFVRPISRIKGAPTCRNIGLEHSKGRYVVYLDSDDYLLEKCLENRVNLFTQYPKNDFLVFPMGIKNNKGLTKKNIKKSDSYLIEFLSFKLPWSIMCPIWKKDYVVRLNGYREGYPRLNDPEFMIRALLHKEVCYKVFHDLDFDTVYVPSEIEGTIYKDKYYKSLLLFIPDVCHLLKKTGNGKLKVYLSNYLHIWFLVFYLPLKTSQVNESLSLIKLFLGKRIISLKSAILIGLNLFGYSFNNYFVQRFRNKLKKKYY